MDYLLTLIGPDWVGSHVRAWVAAGFVALIAYYHPLGHIFTAEVQIAIATALAGIAVGVWGQIVHYLKDKYKVVDFDNPPIRDN